MSVATDKLIEYLAAESAILKGQVYWLNGRKLERANLTEVRDGRREWESKVNSENARASGKSSLFVVGDWT